MQMPKSENGMGESPIGKRGKSKRIQENAASDTSEPKAATDASKRTKRKAAPSAGSMKEKEKVIEAAASDKPSKKRKASQGKVKAAGGENDEDGPSEHPAAAAGTSAAAAPAQKNDKANESKRKAFLARQAKEERGLTYEFKDPELAQIATLLRAQWHESMKNSIAVDHITGDVIGPRPKGLEMRGGKKLAWVRQDDGTYRHVHIRRL